MPWGLTDATGPPIRSPLNCSAYAAHRDGEGRKTRGNSSTVANSPTVAAKPRISRVSEMVTGACLADGIYCATTPSDGVFVFPDRRSARPVARRACRPACVFGQAVAVMNGIIYAGLGFRGEMLLHLVRPERGPL